MRALPNQAAGNAAIRSVARTLLRKTIDVLHNCTRSAMGVRPLVHHMRAFATLTTVMAAMVSIGRPRDIDYYLNEVSVEDAIEYYGQDARGEVSGQLAAARGFAGPIDREQAESLAALRWPDTGEHITDRQLKRPFFDLTISPPKSVSVLWAAADADERAAIETVLAEANRAALDVFEREAAKARRGTAGVEVVDGMGMAFMTFIHTTSRAEDTDPQYHFHNLVLNATTGPDGRTTALDGREVYNHSYPADAVFQATLRDGLRRELGLLFTDVDRHGAAEIVGIGKEVREAFSARRLEILADMSDRGTSSANAARVSALATRQAKSDPDEQELRARWAERFAELGHHNRSLPTLDRDNSYAVDVDAVAEYVTQRSGTYERRHVITAAAHLAIDGATPTQLNEAVDHYLDSHQAIELGPNTYSTPEILELEQRSAQLAERGRFAHAVSVEPETLARTFDNHPELSAEQRNAVEALTTSGARVDLLVGQAGTGKGHVIGVAAQAFQDDGADLIGAALAARTAKQLEASTGIESMTIARLINGIESNRIPLNANTVLVIDEAAMVGTRQAAHLLAEIDQANAKVILVGDSKQLPEIDAGGLFSAIQARIGAAELTENRRLQDPDELDAARALRDGDIDHALNQIQRAGSLTMATSQPKLINQLVDDWYESHRAGERAIMLAPTRYEVADLNHAARHRLRHDGQLGPDLVAVGPTAFAKGDKVLGLRNDYRLGILNGTEAHVVDRTEQGGLRLEADDGTTIDVPPQYLEDGHLTHGYASTVHKAQGITVDQAFLLGSDASYQELGYVGLTRGRQANRFYTVVSRDELGEQRDDRLSDVRNALRQSRAQRAAIDHNIPGRGLT